MSGVITIAVVTPPGEVRVELSQGPGEGRAWVDLSPDEAGRLAAMLLRSAELARQSP